jgi:putative chitinase
MQKINFQKFMVAVQGPFGELNNSQTQGIGYLIDCLEDDIAVNDLRWAAYMLATAWHETGKTMQPIEEYGKGKDKKYGDYDPLTGKAYFGRGYVQLTWKANYMLFTTILKVDLVSHPELALEPDTAYKIMSVGMRKGSFTGVGLPRYFNENRDDPLNARKIINGLDCAGRIAGYHGIFLKAMNEATGGML